MFVIVKNAAPECRNRWHGDPADGVPPSYSCDDTPTGKSLGLKPVYTTKDEAEVDCQRAKHSNPNGYYAVCPILPNGNTSKEIETKKDTTEAWENGTLGCDERYVGVASESELRDIDTALGFDIIDLRLEKEVVEQFKRIAETKGVGYKTLMRVALKALAATGNFTF